jgi:serine/threonine protein kinase
MEYVPYGDLQQRVRSTLPEDEARAITTQILEGLGIMHEHSITHRDLKPQVRFIASILLRNTLTVLTM